MNKRTIRELGGEIWAEISTRRHNGHTKLRDLPQETENEIIDLIIGVLARYKGVQIEDDEDLPVTPLPPYAVTQGSSRTNPTEE